MFTRNKIVKINKADNSHTFLISLQCRAGFLLKCIQLSDDTISALRLLADGNKAGERMNDFNFVLALSNLNSRLFQSAFVSSIHQ
jgi:hypothetical protein